MKILTANIALGLRDMDRLLPALRGHLAFHGRTMLRFVLYPRGLQHSQAYSSKWRQRFLRTHIDMTETLRLIEEAQADVVVLNEVLPQFHKETLDPFFRRLGYKTIVWGDSTHYPDATVSTLVASRVTGTPIPVSLAWESHAGGGAGVGALRLENNVTVIGLHLGVADKFPWLYAAEIRALARFVGQEQRHGREVVVAGDWNTSAAALARFPAFEALGLRAADADVPTCPTFLPWLKPLDHVFVPQHWRTTDVRTIAFCSDHLALCVDAQ